MSDNEETKARVARLVAFISSPDKPHKRPSNHLSDIEVDAKRLRTEAFNIGAAMDQAMDPSASSSSTATSSSIGDLATMRDVYQALEDAEAAEQAPSSSSTPDTFIGHVLSLFLSVIELYFYIC